MQFALLNKSKFVSEQQLQAIATAAANITNAHFCPQWDLNPVSVRVISEPAALLRAEILCGFTDSTEVAEAFGWHDEQNGLPIVVDQVSTVLDGGGGILDGGKAGVSLASVFGHELFETLIDPNINTWVMMPDQTKFLSKEAADPVQSQLIPVSMVGAIAVVEMSDGVYPSYFDQQGKGPFDIAGKITAPFTMLPGGYQIILEAATGKIGNVWGASSTALVKAIKSRKHGRTVHRHLKGERHGE